MGAAALHALGRGGEIASRFAQFPAAQRLGPMLDRRLNSPSTSSAGRLFDAACGLLGIHPVADFEGQAPVALEALATAPLVLEDGWRLDRGTLDFRPLLAALAGCDDAKQGANLFHGTLAAGMAEWARVAAETTGIDTVALGGGCFLNRVLTNDLAARLETAGLRPLTAQTLTPGDAALSLGQAWIAGHLGD